MLQHRAVEFANLFPSGRPLGQLALDQQDLAIEHHKVIDLATSYPVRIEVLEPLP